MVIAVPRMSAQTSPSDSNLIYDFIEKPCHTEFQVLASK